MALAPDISGVCSVVETLETTSKPTKTASTTIVSRVTGVHHVLPFQCGRGAAACRTAAVVGQAGSGDDLVVEVRGDLRRPSVISASRLATFWA